MKKSQINIEVTLDDKKMPEDIQWSASDAQIGEGNKNSKAFLLSLWDSDEKSIYALDLWTKEMTVEEMNHFVFQSLISLSNTFGNATRNKEEAELIKKFAVAFGQRNEVIKKD